ncbi:MAG: hypothetical protein IKP66_04585 [Lachnospiraceae bacterium]|nr:hypothetical protein [Lachnospiraceae bacterium]
MITQSEKQDINLFLQMVGRVDSNDKVVVSTNPTKRELELLELRLMAKLYGKKEFNDSDYEKVSQLSHGNTTGRRFEYPLVDSLGMNINYPNTEDSGKTRLMNCVVIEKPDDVKLKPNLWVYVKSRLKNIL